MWQWNFFKWLRQRRVNRLSRTCGLCGKVWPSKRALGSHKKAHSPKPEEEKYCEIAANRLRHTGIPLGPPMPDPEQLELEKP
jgi:hypothetical protein